MSPLPPPQTSIPYDIVDVAMNFARVKLNDCPLALTGNLLANTQPYAQTICNDAWRNFQEDLDETGEPAATSETIIYSLPAVATIDPGIQVFINQAQYFDGHGYWFPPTVGVLPQNFMSPRWIRERLGGSQAVFTPMQPCDDGLPDGPKTTYLRTWEWRAGNDAFGNAQPLSIWMPGATVPRDIKVRYAAYMADFVTVGSLQWFQQPIPVYRSATAFGFYIAAEFAFSRGSEQANAVGNSFLSMGQAAMRRIMNRTGKIRQRINHRRRSYAAGKHQGWGWW